jgi:YVTN family beta-propeller protein
VLTARLLFGAVLVAAASWPGAAQALTATAPAQESSLVGETFTFRTTVTDAVGAVQVRWSFGDGMRTEFEVGRTEITHNYPAAGHYAVLATVKDDAGFTSVALTHVVHYPLTPKRPGISTAILYDQPRNRIYVVNNDNDSISAIDPTAMTKVAELPVYQRPEALALAPDGKLWVVHRDDYAVAIVDPDKMVIERGFRLPYASQPIGLAMSPTGDAAYITLLALGQVLKLNPSTGEVIGKVDVGSRPRGVSVSHDGKDVFVTRFISSDTQGEVVRLDGPTLKVVNRYALAADTTTTDTDQKGRGLPNYLFAVALSPDGRQAWIPGNKDNIFRGTTRDGQPLTQDNTVRPLVSIIDVAETVEHAENRIDMDDRNLPSYVEFSPLGDFAFVTATGSNLIEIRDTYTRGFITALSDAGVAPRGTVLGPQNRLFVLGSLTRKVVVYDLTDVLNLADPRSKKVTEIPVVTKEKLDADVLLGKQVFFNSSDGRMTIQGYLSCATCHFDGFEDGRVYDFTSRGEGFRNTVSLLGRRGTGQGRVLWSGTFDEIQDFEHQIRDLFLGHGFIPDDVLAQGTRNRPLGDAKKGLSKDLDALAAFVTSLDHVNPSPYRNPDGSMTADAKAGQVLFTKLGCNFCHVGPDLTDSARGIVHDVGTIKATSGTAAGGPLLGIDTPTLLGVWETAPYLHDGSAATLRDVLTTANPNDAHGFVSALSPQQIDQVVAYLSQLDNELPVRVLPFEMGAGGGQADGGTDAPSAEPSAVGQTQLGCTCGLGGVRDTGPLSLLWLAMLVLGWRWRRRGRGANLRGDA